MYEHDVMANIRKCISSLENPEDKFAMLSSFETFIKTIRTEVSNEWTYCARCNQYVKVAERKIIHNENGTYNIACGNCGGLHYVNQRGWA